MADNNKNFDIMPLIYIGGAIALFSVGRSFMEKLGIIDSAEKTAEKQQQTQYESNLTNTAFSPNWYVSVYKKPPAGINRTMLNQLTTAATNNTVINIWDGLGRWYTGGNDISEILGQFKKCHSQYAVSGVAYAFLQKYGKDLITTLQDHLDATNLNKIYSYVSQLPMYY